MIINWFILKRSQKFHSSIGDRLPIVIESTNQSINIFIWIPMELAFGKWILGTTILYIHSCTVHTGWYLYPICYFTMILTLLLLCLSFAALHWSWWGCIQKHRCLQTANADNTLLFWSKWWALVWSISVNSCPHAWLCMNMNLYFRFNLHCYPSFIKALAKKRKRLCSLVFHATSQGLTKINILAGCSGNLYFSFTCLKLFWTCPEFSQQWNTTWKISVTLAHRASDHWNLLDLLALDYQTWILLSPAHPKQTSPETCAVLFRLPDCQPNPAGDHLFPSQQISSATSP